MGARNPSTPKPDQAVPRGKKPAPRELLCKLESGRGKSRQVRTGTAVLTDDELRFRTGRHGREGHDFAVHVAFAEIASLVLEASGAALILVTAEDERYVLHLGRHAPAWLELMKQHKGPLDPFALEPRQRIAVIGVGDEVLLAQLDEAVPQARDVADDAKDLDVVFLGIEHPSDLGRLGPLAKRLSARGVIWAVHPVASRVVKPRDIVVAAENAGLREGTVLVVSRTHEAIRFKPIPR